MSNINYKLQVMQAYANGAEIETTRIGADSWYYTSFPSWNWAQSDYRVKVKSEYTPYTGPDEALKAQKEHGPYIQCHASYKGEEIDYVFYVLPEVITAFGVTFSNDNCKRSYRELLKYKWQDDTVCGNLLT